MLKSYTKYWKIESEYDPIGHFVIWETMIKLEDVFSNIGHEFCTDGKWIFDANMLKVLT